MFPRQAPAVLPLVDDQGNEKDFLMCREGEIVGIVHGLAARTEILGLDGALLKLEPVSLARPDAAYKNIAEIDEAVRTCGSPARRPRSLPSSTKTTRTRSRRWLPTC
jgi:hypothetical protein